MAKLQKTSQEMFPSVTITDVYCTGSNLEVPVEAIEIAKILARIVVDQHLLKISETEDLRNTNLTA